MTGGRRVIEPISFARERPLPMEVLSLRALHARRPRDLTRPERPDFHVLLLVTAGQGAHTVDFVQHRLGTGQVLLVAAGQVHHFEPPGQLEGTLLVFRPPAVRWAPRPGAPVLSLPPDRQALVMALLGHLEQELAGARSLPVATQLLETIGAVLLAGTPAPSEAQRLVERFRAELERHHRQAHEVSAYAAILRCTTRTLARHCRRSTGQTPKQLIDQRLALEARRSLAHEDCSAADLAETLGFGSPTQFVKFFRRVTGETPGAFRRRSGVPPE